MDKKRLEQLRDLQMELRYRENEIGFLKDNAEYVADTAKDYRRGFGRVIVIRGYSDKKYRQKQKIYESRKEKLAKEIDEVEQWIETVKDPQMRVIFSLRYKDGLSMAEIGSQLHMDRRTVARKIEKFFEEK